MSSGRFVGPFVGMVLGFLLGGSVFWGVFGPNITESELQTITQREHLKSAEENAELRKERSDEALAQYTKWLTFATVGLVAATIFLGWTGEKQLDLIRHLTDRQASDTRILQRAYLSVIPRGVTPYLSTEDRLGCDVSFYNAGALPAREVCWFINKALSIDAHRKDFPIANDRFYGSNIIPPKSEMRKGAEGMDAKPLAEFIEGGNRDDRWLYVWGQVRYKDGFGMPRFTSFCHRYNLLGIDKNTIPAENGRFHEYGNYTDEEPSHA
jgi:hypothetical protein